MPAPIPDHQRFVRNVFLVLHEARPDDRLEVFFAPLDWQPDDRTSLEPDVLVVERDRVGPKVINERLLLAVEVLSPCTRRKDRVLKFSKYEEAGVRSCWVVDPDGPSVTAWSLRDGRYAEIGTASGDDLLELDEPFPVRVQPSTLHR